jgi:NADP-dependent 3-hydroxy acid dehydrogenase YdfG
MKNAIVFGATSGIGNSITQILLKEGYRVAITGRRLEKLEALKELFPDQILVKQ